MAMRMSISSAKRLGFSIKGYVFDKSSKIPVPVLEKTKKSTKKTKQKQTRKIELIDEGIICRLNLKEEKWLKS